MSLRHHLFTLGAALALGPALAATATSPPATAPSGFALSTFSDSAFIKKAEVAASRSSPAGLHLASFGDIVEASSPSVVQVRVQKKSGSEGAAEEESSILDFMKRFGTPDAPGKKDKAPRGQDEMPDEKSGKAPSQSAPRIPFPNPPAKRPGGGVGSGFFIDESGYLLTNAHVVEGAQKIVLSLSNKTEVEARLVGVDKRTDIALLKVEPKAGRKFKALPLGSTDKLRVGDWVLAIGSPFGLESSATAGILSAKGRAIPSEENNYIPFLQTDAAVNPGNSGGPLINERGQAIGINTQIYSRSGGYMGISFAIPIEYAVKIAGKILKGGGKMEHGRIGANVQDLVPELADAFGVPGKGGAIILSVEPASPSEAAGMKAGDAVILVDGKPIEGASELIRLIADSDPGERVVFGILRRGQNLQIPVTLGAGRPTPTLNEKEEQKAPEPSKIPSWLKTEPLGIKGRPLSAIEAKAEGVAMGVKVLESTGLAEEAGIDSEEVVVEVDHYPVGKISDIAEIVEKAPGGRHLALLIKRGELVRYVAINPDLK